MRPLQLLKCLAKALLRQAGNAVGFGVAGDVVADVGAEAWKEWQEERDEAGRHAEVEAIVQMAAQEFRRQVEEVVHEVAAGQPAEVRQNVSRLLEELPDRLRLSLYRSAEAGDQGAPALPLRQAQDLVSLLTASDHPTRTPAPKSPPRELPPPARVTLTLAGGGPGWQLVFEERTTCIIGRQDDCHPRFPNDDKHRTISRHHCLLDVNPPDICVRDLGSRGGTYVNGLLVDKRPEGMDRDEALKLRFKERNLTNGDELRLCKGGAAVFRVSVTVPTLCASCGTWIPEEARAACERAPGLYQCEACAAKPTIEGSQRPLRACAGCGRDVSGDVGTNRHGEFLCAACRQDPERLVRDLQGQARHKGEVLAIEGYTILTELGRGGMGSVWLARHDSTGRQVAIKVMLPQVAADERAVKRFLHETANTRALNHPNVVRLIDSGYARGMFFMVLDYCEGGSVSGLMQQRGGMLPVDEAAEIALQALEGLHYAHNVFGPGSGLVHRDLKPANLFLSGTGSARVARIGDYGLSKAFDDAGLSGATRTGDIAGTPHFMPRLQVIDFKYARPEVDVWAMAASLYNMLTGAVPRDFPATRDPWLVVLDDPPVPIRRRLASLPEKLAEVIDHALTEEPEIPFKTAAEFKEALENAL
jgi:serine/threonine-protein kinase